MIDQISIHEQKLLLQDTISAPSLIEGLTTVKRAIEVCHASWIFQIDSSQDSANTYSQMVCMLLGSIPFKTLAVAARTSELQDKMIAALAAMSPEQQSVVIPQLDNEKLANHLKTLPTSKQASLLGMATGAQKIFYLQTMNSDELISKEMRETASKWVIEKSALEEEITAFAKRAKTNPKNGESFNALSMKISTKINTLNFRLKAENLILNQLITKLADLRESSEDLLQLIESKPKALIATFNTSLDINSLTKALEKVAEDFGLKEEPTPSEFICPISQEVMEDPVKASDGKVYDRKSIEDWVKNSNTSPMTRETLTDVFKPQLVLKLRILAWLIKGKPSAIETIELD